MATLAPSRAARSAMARPIPREPPLMKMVLPASVLFMTMPRGNKRQTGAGWLVLAAGRPASGLCSVQLKDGPETLPARAIEPVHLHLLDRVVIRRRRIDLDAGQQEVKLQVLQALGLLQDVGAREIIAALPEDMRHRLRGHVAVGDVPI